MLGVPTHSKQLWKENRAIQSSHHPKASIILLVWHVDSGAYKFSITTGLTGEREIVSLNFKENNPLLLGSIKNIDELCTWRSNMTITLRFRV